jgi:hypothetical protein
VGVYVAARESRERDFLMMSYDESRCHPLLGLLLSVTILVLIGRSWLSPSFGSL